ncbi:Pentatricopeptide repeat-containing protein At2g41720 (Protein EMBRYO DEFECTIVE 2654) [Durusdinium trenchii]
MDISEVRANVISQNNVLHACRRTDQWPQSLHAMARMREWTSPNEISYSTTLQSSALASRWRDAISLCSTAALSRLSGNEVVQNAMLAGGWRQALRRLHMMEQGECRPNLVSINSVLHECEAGASWCQSLRLLRVAISGELRPDVISYTSAATCCTLAQQSLAAVMLMEHMSRVDG